MGVKDEHTLERKQVHTQFPLFIYFFTWNALLNTGQTMEVLVVITVNISRHFNFKYINFIKNNHS